MKKIYIALALLTGLISFGQPLDGQPTGPATNDPPAWDGWSMTDYWVVMPYATIKYAQPGNANMPVLFWGDQGLLSAGASLNTYLAGYAPTTRTITINGTSFDLSENRAWSNVGIELPSQAGNANKILQTNGTSASWVTPTASFTYSAPTSPTSITSGTAFQPRSGGACNLNINSQMTGLVGVAGTITIGISATSGGTYTTVASDSALISVLNQTLDRSSPTISVPAGYWVKVTYAGTGTITGTYTRTDIN